METKEILEEIDGDFYTAEEYDIEEIMGIDSSGLSTKDREILEESKKIIIQLKNLIKNSKYATAAATGLGALGIGYGAYKMLGKENKLSFWLKMFNLLPERKRLTMYHHGLPYFDEDLRLELAKRLPENYRKKYLREYSQPMFIANEQQKVLEKRIANQKIMHSDFIPNSTFLKAQYKDINETEATKIETLARLFNKHLNLDEKEEVAKQANKKSWSELMSSIYQKTKSTLSSWIPKGSDDEPILETS